MDHRDPSPWRRLPGSGDAVPEGQAGSERARARHRGLRHVRRLSNWTAAGLVAATAVTAGYFAHASTSPQQATSASRPQSKAPASSSSQACTTAVTAPVAVSGGSGVTATVPSQTPVPGQTCAPGTGNGAPPVVVYREPHENEKGDS
jgi:hypothetical protein